MSMKVQCPSCHTELRVPENAGGRTARCPVCRHKFRVPDPQELLEDAVSQWIEEDPDDADDDEKDDAPARAPMRGKPARETPVAPPGLPGLPGASSGRGGAGAPGVPGLPGLPSRPPAAGAPVSASASASAPGAPAPAAAASATNPRASTSATPRPAANAPNGAMPSPVAPTSPTGRPLTPVPADSAVVEPVDRPDVPRSRSAADPGSDEIAVVQRLDTPARRADVPATARPATSVQPANDFARATTSPQVQPVAADPVPHAGSADAVESLAAGSAADADDIDLADMSSDAANAPARPATRPPSSTNRPAAATAPARATAPSRTAAQDPSASAARVPPASPSAALAPPAATPAQPSAPLPTPLASSATSPPSVAFPSDLFVAGIMPHLVVVNCNQDGVTFAFDAAFLAHPGFRRSMPVRCAISGQAARAELVARPLAFTDRAPAQIRSPREIEIHHEVHLDAGHSPAALVAAMKPIEGLPAPFNQPLPYYVASNHALASVQCITLTRDDGGITCQVLIPDAQAALEWLLHVNGVCGPEYLLLERAIALLWSDAWRALPDKVRQRLNVWCGFEPMESFRLYLPDADFGAHDLGLAGIVLTDRRLIYCKLHHRGQALLDHEATLRVTPEGDFASLALQTGEGRVKIAKLSLDDLPALIKAGRDATGLKLQLGGAE